MMGLARKQAGLSLVELMVSVALSLILTLGIIQIFSSSKQTGRVQNALARVQENARFALDLLSRDIRMAGQLGCNSDAFVTDSSNGQLATGPFSSGVFGYEYSDPMTVNLTNSNASPDEDTVVNGTDVIVVMAASANGTPITSSSDDTITVDTSADLDDGDPMLISDCDTADLFVVDSHNDSSITASANLSKNYAAGAEVARLNYTAYYLRVKDGQRNLYRTFVNGVSSSAGISTDPLLEGVQDLQILYGETQSDGKIRYVDSDPDNNPATNDLDWNKVVSVRINLLMRTEEDNLASKPQQYWFMDQLYTANDKHLYRSFTTTIQLRNQGIGT
jgi:type IV pilus assembly protein PilW